MEDKSSRWISEWLLACHLLPWVSVSLFLKCESWYLPYRHRRITGDKVCDPLSTATDPWHDSATDILKEQVQMPWSWAPRNIHWGFVQKQLREDCYMCSSTEHKYNLLPLSVFLFSFTQFKPLPKCCLLRVNSSDHLLLNGTSHQFLPSWFVFLYSNCKWKFIIGSTFPLNTINKLLEKGTLQKWCITKSFLP